MKKFVVRLMDGFCACKTKKEALMLLKDDKNAIDVILSGSKAQNYWHNKVNVIAKK